MPEEFFSSMRFDFFSEKTPNNTGRSVVGRDVAAEARFSRDIKSCDKSTIIRRGRNRLNQFLVEGTALSKPFCWETGQCWRRTRTSFFWWKVTNKNFIEIFLGSKNFLAQDIDLMPRSPSVPTAAYGGLIYVKRRFHYAILLFVLLLA